MTFLQSILFLILYVGLGVGVPLMWFAKQVGKHGKKDERF
jgi:hypothetical protein